MIYYSYQNKQRAVRIGDWKLIRYNVAGVGHAQLFNLAADPFETKSLIGSTSSFERYKELDDALRKQMRQENDPAFEQIYPRN